MNADKTITDNATSDLHVAPAMGIPDERWLCWFRQHSHRHTYHEFAVCLHGTHGYGVDGRVVNAKPGAIWIMPTGIPHDAAYGTPHNASLDFWVHLLPGGYATCNLVEHNPGRPLDSTPLTWPTSPVLAADVQRLRTMLRAEPESHIRVTPKTAHFLCYIASYFTEHLVEHSTPRSSPEQQSLMEAIKRYIADNLSDDLHLKDLAKLAGYSPYHFHRLFSDSQGCTPRQYVEQQRVRSACALLEAGQTVTAAGSGAGFSSPADFSRIFKRVFGLSPTEWLRTR